jgi:aminocarboxymuconate-semialdehyde decarboxylase
MTRLIYAKIFDELPTLKIITHHMGGMISFFAGKINLGFRQIFFGTPERNPAAEGLKRPPMHYYKRLYADTALNGEIEATRCGHAFFGTPNCLFATDAPFDCEGGRILIRETIRAVEALPIPAAEREKIFAGNARDLLKLPTGVALGRVPA